MKTRIIIVLIVLAIGGIGISTHYYFQKDNTKKTSKYSSSEEMLDYYKNNYDTNDTMYLLKDIDGDNNKDLVVMDNCEVIVVANHKEIKEVGRHDFVTGTIQFYESASKKYPGIFYSYASGGRNYYGYLSLKNNKLAVLKLWNKDYSGIYKETGEKKIEYQSKNEDLLNESKNSCKSKYILKFKDLSDVNWKKSEICDEDIQNFIDEKVHEHLAEVDASKVENYEITKNDDKAISVVFTVDEYKKGAAHPFRNAFAVNVDKKAKKELDVTQTIKELKSAELDGYELANIVKDVQYDILKEEPQKFQRELKGIKPYQVFYTDGGAGVIIELGYAEGSYSCYKTELLPEELETYSKERSLNSIKDENIKNVMLNKTKYYNTATKKMEYIKDFKYTSFMDIDKNGKCYYYESFSDDPIKLEITSWCEVDIDKDQKQEVVLICQDSTEIVFDSESRVCGYVFPFRGMKGLKKNGLSARSGSAADTYIGRPKFYNEKCFFEYTAISDGYEKRYELNGKKVSKKEANKYINAFYDRQDDEVIWYEW